MLTNSLSSGVRRCACLIALALAAGTAQARDEALLRAATAEQPAVLQTLERLVQIETGSQNTEGLAQMGNHVASEPMATAPLAPASRTTKAAWRSSCTR